MGVRSAGESDVWGFRPLPRWAGVVSVLAGVLGAVLGNSGTAKRSAGAGPVLGGVKGNKYARHEQNRIVKRGLIERGYKVLN